MTCKCLLLFVLSLSCVKTSHAGLYSDVEKVKRYEGFFLQLSQLLDIYASSEEKGKKFWNVRLLSRPRAQFSQDQLMVILSNSAPNLQSVANTPTSHIPATHQAPSASDHSLSLNFGTQTPVWSINQETKKIESQPPITASPIQLLNTEGLDVWLRLIRYPADQSNTARRPFRQGSEGQINKFFFCHYIQASDVPDTANMLHACQVCVEFSSRSSITSFDHSIEALRASSSLFSSHLLNGAENEIARATSGSIFGGHLNNDDYQSFLSSFERNLHGNFLNINDSVHVDVSKDYPATGLVEVEVIGRGQFSVVFAFKNILRGLALRRFPDFKTPQEAHEFVLTHEAALIIYDELKLSVEPTELIIVKGHSSYTVYLIQKHLDKDQLAEFYIDGLFRFGPSSLAKTLTNQQGGQYSHDLTYAEASIRILKAVIQQIYDNLKELHDNELALMLCSDAKPDNFSIAFKHICQWLRYKPRHGDLYDECVLTTAELTDFHPCSLVLFDRLLFDGGPKAKLLQKILGTNPFDVYQEKIKTWADAEKLVTKSMANIAYHGGDIAETYIPEMIRLVKMLIRDLWFNDPELKRRHHEYELWRVGGYRAPSNDLPVEHLFFDLDTLTTESVLAYRNKSFANNLKLKLNYYLLKMAREQDPVEFDFKDYIPVDHQQDWWLKVVHHHHKDDFIRLLNRRLEEIARKDISCATCPDLHQLIQQITSSRRLVHESKLLRLFYWYRNTHDLTQLPESLIKEHNALMKDHWLRRIHEQSATSLSDVTRKAFNEIPTLLKDDEILFIHPESAGAMENILEEREQLEQDIFNYLFDIYAAQENPLEQSPMEIRKSWVKEFHPWYSNDIQQVLAELKKDSQAQGAPDLNILTRNHPYVELLISRLLSEYWKMEADIFLHLRTHAVRVINGILMAPNLSGWQAVIDEHYSEHIQRIIVNITTSRGLYSGDTINKQLLDQEMLKLARRLVREPNTVENYIASGHRLTSPIPPELSTTPLSRETTPRSTGMPNKNDKVNLSDTPDNAQLIHVSGSACTLTKKTMNTFFQNLGLYGLSVTHEDPRAFPEAYSRLKNLGWQDSIKMMQAHYNRAPVFSMPEDSAVWIEPGSYPSQELAEMLMWLMKQDQIRFPRYDYRNSVIQAVKAILPHRTPQHQIKPLIIIDASHAIKSTNSSPDLPPRVIMLETKTTGSNVSIQQTSVDSTAIKQLIRSGVSCDYLLRILSPDNKDYWFTLSYNAEKQRSTEEQAAEYDQRQNSEASPQAKRIRLSESPDTDLYSLTLAQQQQQAMAQLERQKRLEAMAEQRRANAAEVERRARQAIQRQLIPVASDHFCMYNSLAYLLSQNHINRRTIIQKIVVEIASLVSLLQHQNGDPRSRALAQGFYRNLIFLALKSNILREQVKLFLAHLNANVSDVNLDLRVRRLLHKVLISIIKNAFHLQGISIDEISLILENLPNMGLQELIDFLVKLINEAGYNPAFDIILADEINQLLAPTPLVQQHFIQNLIPVLQQELMANDANLTPQLLFVGLGAHAITNILAFPHHPNAQLLPWILPNQANNTMWGNDSILAQLFLPFLNAAGIMMDVMIVMPAIDNPEAPLVAMFIQNHPEEGVNLGNIDDQNTIMAHINNPNVLTLFNGALGNIDVIMQGQSPAQHWQPVNPATFQPQEPTTETNEEQPTCSISTNTELPELQLDQPELAANTEFSTALNSLSDQFSLDQINQLMTETFVGSYLAINNLQQYSPPMQATQYEVIRFSIWVLQLFAMYMVGKNN